jgi:hypothetical protein
VRDAVPPTLSLIGAGRGGIDPSAAPKGTPDAASGDAVLVIGSQIPCKTAVPLLLMDIDGVLSLFGFRSDERPPGTWIQVDGSPHFISADAAAHLLALGDLFEIVWCSGWEERANEHLPALLGLPSALPYLSFDRNPGRDRAHWKLAAIDAHAGLERPLAWIDDAFNEACERWAAERSAQTLLVRTDPAVGLTAADVERLRGWAQTLDDGRAA